MKFLCRVERKFGIEVNTPSHTRQGDFIFQISISSDSYRPKIYISIVFWHPAFITASLFIQISNINVDRYSDNSDHVHTGPGLRLINLFKY